MNDKLSLNLWFKPRLPKLKIRVWSTKLIKYELKSVGLDLFSLNFVVIVTLKSIAKYKQPW